MHWQSGGLPIDGHIIGGTSPQSALVLWADAPASSNGVFKVVEIKADNSVRTIYYKNLPCQNGICKSEPIYGSSIDPRPSWGGTLLATIQVYGDSGKSQCSTLIYADDPGEAWLLSFFKSKLTLDEAMKLAAGAPDQAE